MDFASTKDHCPFEYVSILFVPTHLYKHVVIYISRSQKTLRHTECSQPYDCIIMLLNIHTHTSVIKPVTFDKLFFPLGWSVAQ